MHADARKLLWDAQRAADRIAHASVDNRLVWGVVEGNLERLRTTLNSLVDE